MEIKVTDSSTTTWKYANIFRRPRESGDPVAFVNKTLDSLPAFAGTKGPGNDGKRISRFRDLRVEKLVACSAQFDTVWLSCQMRIPADRHVAAE
jgi:hypothetical protein